MSCAPAVTFSPTAWAAEFPEFAAIPSAQAQGYFNRATLLCANKLNPVRTVEALTALLYLLTAHIAALNSPVTAAGASSSTPTGRVSQAAEGSVNVTYTNDYPPGTPQWYQSSRYGSEYFTASLPYRLFKYKAQRSNRDQLPWLGS